MPGLIDTPVSFAELAATSLINEAARAAEGAPDFPERIQARLTPVLSTRW